MTATSTRRLAALVHGARDGSLWWRTRPEPVGLEFMSGGDRQLDEVPTVRHPLHALQIAGIAVERQIGGRARAMDA